MGKSCKKLIYRYNNYHISIFLDFDKNIFVKSDKCIWRVCYETKEIIGYCDGSCIIPVQPFLDSGAGTGIFGNLFNGKNRRFKPQAMKLSILQTKNLQEGPQKL